jgi:hypothetical protein
MSRSSQYPWKAPLVNWDPLSVMIRFGTPNLHMMDLMNFIADCLLILTTGVASDHLVNLSMATYRNLYTPTARGNGPTMSSPHTSKGHEGGIICSVCDSMWICLTWN